MTYSTKEDKLTQKKALSLIHNYNKNFDIYMRLCTEYDGYTTGVKAPKYGLEASLPKGNNAKSDIIQFEVQRLMKQNKTLQNYEMKIKQVQLVRSWLTDETQIEVLDMRMSGKTLKEICVTLRKSKAQIYPIFEAIADIMVERI